MTINARRMYAVAAVLAAVAAVLQIIDRDWFRVAISGVLAAAMALAASGFPEKSAANMRIYYAMLGVVAVMLGVRIFLRFQ